MQTRFGRLLVVVSLAVLLSLAACGQGGGSTAPTAEPPTSEPAAAAPTRTPRPTREPVALPTAEPTAVAIQPTAVAAAPGEVLMVEFGPLRTYSHPSGVFAIDIPENWSLQDNSKPDEIILVWTDPTQNGGVIVDIFEDETVYSEEELTEILRAFLDNSFGSQPEFSVDEPVTQNDGSILLVWTYLATADNNTEVPLLGNSFIEQRGNKVSILTTLIPDDQFDDLVDNTDEIINTYVINRDAPLSSGDSGGSGILGSGGLGSGSTGELPSTIVGIGDQVSVGDGLNLTVTGVEAPEGDQFFTPEAGNQFLIVRATFENSGSTAQPVSSLLQMSLLDEAGNSYDLDLIATVLAEQTLDGEVPAGGSLSGGAGFQVPVGTQGLVFVYNPLIDGTPVGVVLD
jgi:predicted small lipoprotein YifL